VKTVTIKTILYHGHSELFRSFFILIRSVYNSVQIYTKNFYFLFSENLLIESQILLREVTKFLSVLFTLSHISMTIGVRYLHIIMVKQSCYRPGVAQRFQEV
jgi:hypothetical protein